MRQIINKNCFGRVFLALLLIASSVGVSAEGHEQTLDLETIFASDTFSPQLPKALHWLPVGDEFSHLRQSGSDQLLVRRTTDGSEVETINLSRLRGLPKEFRVSDYRWNPEAEVLLLQGPVTTDWMGYRHAPWYVVDTSEFKLRPLGEAGQAVQLVKLAPGGGHAGFVFENNLYLVDLDSSAVIPVTTDGNEHIFNAVFDYGSTEFGPVDGWRWSPTGTHLAYWRMDANEVRTYPLIDELHSYSEVREFHYPNTGERHAINEIHVFRLETGKTNKLDLAHDPDDYLPELNWNAAGDALVVQHLARDHKTLKLWEVGLSNEKPRLLLQEQDPAWIDITHDLQPLADGTLLWTSERSGFRHIYHLLADGKQRPVTSGEWSVDRMIGVSGSSPGEHWVYFYAKKDSLIDQFVYRVNLEDGRQERLTDRPGWHEWAMSPGGEYVLAKHSDANTPHTQRLLRSDGERLLSLVEDSVPAFSKYELATTEFVTFPLKNGVELNGFFIRPPDFDPSKKYPVIAYGYGNAGSQVVVNRWGTQRGPTQDLWHRYLAQQGYVVFTMDNRTTAGRGKAAKNLTYGEYGKYAVLDYIEGVEYLKAQPWIDGERIGFWGWSGGGYLAAALMTKAAPLFKVAVSVAPVIDLTRYQAVGVERWMGTPQENPEGYAAVNLMNYADQLEGKLLLIHGTGDENVKFAFTLQFADALIKAGKQFDMLVYPNQRHAIADYRLHVFSTMTRYFEEHL